MRRRRDRAARRRARAALAAAFALACGPDAAREPPATGPAAPPLLRGTLSIEPPRIQIGDVAELEVAVATPPDHRLHPLEPPDALAGFWVLDATELPVEAAGGRWIHRTRLRLRAHAVGRHAWPPLSLDVEGPDGVRRGLSIAGRTLEVVSVLPEAPDRSGPFGLRQPPARAERGGVLLPGMLGAALALASVGLVALLARRRRRGAPAAAWSAPGTPVADPPEVEGAAAVRAALERVETDPRGAANEAAAALRHFLARRFRFAAARAQTTEELESARVPRDRCWGALLEVLRDLDAARFRPDAARADRVRDALRAAQRALRATRPTERTP